MSGELRSVRWGAESREARGDLSMEKQEFCWQQGKQNRPVREMRPGVGVQVSWNEVARLGLTPPRLVLSCVGPCDPCRATREPLCAPLR